MSVARLKQNSVNTYDACGANSNPQSQVTTEPQFAFNLSYISIIQQINGLMSSNRPIDKQQEDIKTIMNRAHQQNRFPYSWEELSLDDHENYKSFLAVGLKEIIYNHLTRLETCTVERLKQTDTSDYKISGQETFHYLHGLVFLAHMDIQDAQSIVNERYNAEINNPLFQWLKISYPHLPGQIESLCQDCTEMQQHPDAQARQQWNQDLTSMRPGSSQHIVSENWTSQYHCPPLPYYHSSVPGFQGEGFKSVAPTCRVTDQVSSLEDSATRQVNIRNKSNPNFNRLNHILKYSTVKLTIQGKGTAPVAVAPKHLGTCVDFFKVVRELGLGNMKTSLRRKLNPNQHSSLFDIYDVTKLGLQYLAQEESSHALDDSSVILKDYLSGIKLKLETLARTEKLDLDKPRTPSWFQGIDFVQTLQNATSSPIMMTTPSSSPEYHHPSKSEQSATSGSPKTTGDDTEYSSESVDANYQPSTLKQSRDELSDLFEKKVIDVRLNEYTSDNFIKVLDKNPVWAQTLNSRVGRANTMESFTKALESNLPPSHRATKLQGKTVQYAPAALEVMSETIGVAKEKQAGEVKLKDTASYQSKTTFVDREIADLDDYKQFVDSRLPTLFVLDLDDTLVTNTLPPALMDTVISEKVLEEKLGYLPVHSNTKVFLQEIKNATVCSKVILVSNSSPQSSHTKLRNLELEDTDFDYVSDRTEVPAGSKEGDKDDRVRNICSKLNFTPKQVVILDDEVTQVTRIRNVAPELGATRCVSLLVQAAVPMIHRYKAALTVYDHPGHTVEKYLHDLLHDSYECNQYGEYKLDKSGNRKKVEIYKREHDRYELLKKQGPQPFTLETASLTDAQLLKLLNNL